MPKFCNQRLKKISCANSYMFESTNIFLQANRGVVRVRFIKKKDLLKKKNDKFKEFKIVFLLSMGMNSKIFKIV